MSSLIQPASGVATGFPKSIIGRFFGFLFCSVFLAGGVASLWFTVMQPSLHWLQARQWIAYPAKIHSIELASAAGSEGGTVYSIAARFSYSHEGRRFVSDRFGFKTGKTNVGVETMRRKVREFRENPHPTCWVNPEDPSQAVLDRTLPNGTLPGVFFSLPFLTVGLIGTTWMLFGPALANARKNRHARLLENLARQGLIDVPASSPQFSPAADNDRGVIFARSQSLANAGGITAINLFWNGIVAVFLSILVTEWLSGEHQWFLAVFLIPFVAIGLVFLAAAITAWRTCLQRDFVALAMPTPTLDGGVIRFSLAFLPPGGAFHQETATARLVARARVVDESQKPSTLRFRFPWQKAPRASDNPTNPEKSDHILATVDIPRIPGSSEIQLPPVPDHRGDPAKSWHRQWELEVTDHNGIVSIFDFRG